MSEGWHRFAAFVERTPDVPIGRLIADACKNEPPSEVVAAYEAPFPDERSKGRVPGPFRDDSAVARGARGDGGQAVAEALSRDRRPSLLMWADADPVLPLESDGRQVQALFPTADEPTVIDDASHFLPEDQGEQIGALIADWLGTQARRRA